MITSNQTKKGQRRIKASDTFNENYIPTIEEKKKVRLKHESFQLSGDSVFHTIQGEGNWIGRPVTFIRLAFCNLACSFCDTFYTWKKDTPEFWQETWDLEIHKLKDLIIQAQKDKGLTSLCTTLVFTGGEPMLQQGKIAKFLQENPEFTTEIETNGTIVARPEIKELVQQKRIKFNCSPKLMTSHNGEKRFNKRALEWLNSTPDIAFKFVCSTPEDIEEVETKFDFIDRKNILIMPEGVSKEENTKSYENMNAKLIACGFRTTPRLQNIMFDGAKRAV